MNSIKAVRRINFCAGHRVYGHESKCRHLHGHNFQVFFHAKSDTGLDSLGRVIDFGVLKQRLGDWLEVNWDHGTILWENDTEARAALALLPEQKLFLSPTNPTAENLAEYLLATVCPHALADTGIYIEKVVVWETENCFAEVELYERVKPHPATAARS